MLILDEPTNGLDPHQTDEMRRLIQSLARRATIILSTHIVEDVADLCPRMAVLAGGKIQLEGAPADLMARMSGRVWQKTIDRDALEEYRATVEVISTRLFAGRTVIHVLADTSPGAGFTPVSGGLEDVYFSTLSASRRLAA